MYYRLLIDKYSTFKKKHQYGKRGERVKHISQSDTVLIVEGKSGRFSIKRNEVTNTL
jgi:predicted proteasome-type protease